MTSEKQKMISGALYRPGDPELVRDRARNQELQRRYNATIVSDRQDQKTKLEDWQCRRRQRIARVLVPREASH